MFSLCEESVGLSSLNGLGVDMWGQRGRLRIIGAVTAALALSAGSFALGATATAATPTPSYTAGNDNATYTLNGVVDGNCPLSVGGTEVWIKPGDSITFNTALAGINLSVVQSTLSSAVLGLLNTLGGILGLGPQQNLTTADIAGMDVTASIGGSSFSVPAGGTKEISGLAAGNYTMTWTASDIVLIPKLNGIKVPLSSSELDAGAQLSWTGTVYVNSGAPQCKLALGTPKTTISVGKLHITVPPVNISVPTPKIPGVTAPLSTAPSTAPTKTTGGSTSKSTAPTGGSTLLPVEPVPAMVVPSGSSGGTYGGGGSGGYAAGSLPTGNLGSLAPLVVGGKKLATQNSSGKGKSINLASSTKPDASGGQLPVILAILAIIALSLVAATYARL
jgi:hypothetical protein